MVAGANPRLLLDGGEGFRTASAPHRRLRRHFPHGCFFGGRGGRSDAAGGGWGGTSGADPSAACGGTFPSG